MAIRTAAAELGEAYSEVNERDFPATDSCGSALVSETLDLFVREFAKALVSGKDASASLAEAMVEVADDFNQVEQMNVQSIEQYLRIGPLQR